MKFVTYLHQSQPRAGIVADNTVLDLVGLIQAFNSATPITAWNDLRHFIADSAALQVAANALAWWETARTPDIVTLPLGEAQLYAPILAPEKIVCVGLNYRRHAAESGMAVPTSPVLFSKFNNTLAGAGEAIPLPAVATQYDYEVELAVVIGREAASVSEEEALNYVFGYCTANDLSARDLQMRTSQWLLGKTLDKFLPLGPAIVTADGVDDPQALAVRGWVNGDLRQNANTAGMVFPWAHLVSYISQHMTLQPGDIILTGTPEGVVLGRAQKDWLVPGDEVVVEVEKLGKLANPMVKG
ncbi:MAG: fumarylacetoacetate hydrolase family protein [Anaerolineales bacterium]|nr:fumarylacetoacetate hydrolase family protein [Anaerolineales bacterium]